MSKLPSGILLVLAAVVGVVCIALLPITIRYFRRLLTRRKQQKLFHRQLDQMTEGARPLIDSRIEIAGEGNARGSNLF